MSTIENNAAGHYSSFQVGSLSATERGTIEKLIGKTLADGQQVTVAVGPPRPAITAEEKAASWQRIREFQQEVRRNMDAAGITEEVFEAAVDEAMKHVRPGYERI